MTAPHRLSRIALASLLALPLAPLLAQTTTPPTKPQTQPDDAGPQQQNDGVIIKKKTDTPDDAPPPAPAEEKIKNPEGLGNYSLRVDVPVVTVDVSVQLDKTRQFVPGLKSGNFRVSEDGVPQKVSEVRMRQAPITAVMLLEFAANSWSFIQDMQQSSYVFFRSLKPEDYIAVITFDLRTHILTDFTRDKDLTAQALRTLTIPGFSDTDEFDALYDAKLAVLQALIATEVTGYAYLAVAAVVFSLIGAFYYLRIIKVMFFDEPLDREPLRPGLEMRAVLSLNGLAVLVLGILPGGLMALCLQAISKALST